MLKSIIIPYILFIFTASQLHTAPRQSTQADTSGHPTLTLHKNINIHAQRTQYHKYSTIITHHHIIFYYTTAVATITS